VSDFLDTPRCDVNTFGKQQKGVPLKMSQSQTLVSKTVNFILLGSILSICLEVSHVGAATFGVESTNPSDRPPVVNPDVSLRSSDPDGPPAYGPEDAKVLIAVFNNFQCPHCRRSSQAIHQIAFEFPDEVRIEIFHSAPPGKPGPEIAAIASIAAQNQGQFWEMYDKILARPGSVSMATFEQYAQELGLDMERFRSDMNDPAVKERVREESQLAIDLGFRGTPIFFINAKPYYGWASWKYFRKAVASELAKARALADEGLPPLEIQLQSAMNNSNDSETFELYRVGILEK
jgi:protein-disulfide isomerase